MKSLQRILAIVRKEVRQLRRDRLTFGMIVGIRLANMVFPVPGGPIKRQLWAPAAATSSPRLT